jgi:hypothetical protein
MTASGVADPTPGGPVAIRVIGVDPRKNADPGGRTHLGACLPPAEDPGERNRPQRGQDVGRSRPQRGQKTMFAVGPEAVQPPAESGVHREYACPVSRRTLPPSGTRPRSLQSHNLNDKDCAADVGLTCCVGGYSNPSGR